MRCDRGAVTAEVAVALPVIVLVLVGCLGGMLAAADLVRLQDTAADAARLLGRGDTSVGSHIERAIPGARASVQRSGSLVCVQLVTERHVLGLPLEVQASSCALDGGQ